MWRNVVEKMWLNYYHNELLARGLITESMYRKMKVQISTRIPAPLNCIWHFPGQALIKIVFIRQNRCFLLSFPNISATLQS